MAWIDFKALRAELSFAQVLAHYRVELKSKKGAQQQGICPFPTHEGPKRSPSFSANVEQGLFQCFSCGAKGNVLDFAVLMDGGNPANGKDVQKTALKLQQQFSLGGSGSEPRPGNAAGNRVPQEPQPKAKPPAQQKAGQAATRPAIVNAPLDFELKGLDPQHPYLKQRGFTQQTIEFFGLGYCARGTFQGRIAIPLNDTTGQLIGYSGRLVDDSKATDLNPTYKLPPSRLHNDQVYEFDKTRFLYNGHRITGPVSDLVVVQGFPSTWWLWQHGYPNVVALMGSTCSPEQAKLIVEHLPSDGRVWILPDGNQAGARCAATLLSQVACERWCRWVRLKDNEQPTDCTAEDLASLLPFQPYPEGGMVDAFA